MGPAIKSVRKMGESQGYGSKTLELQEGGQQVNTFLRKRESQTQLSPGLLSDMSNHFLSSCVLAEVGHDPFRSNGY